VVQRRYAGKMKSFFADNTRRGFCGTIRTDHMEAMDAVKRAIILLRFDWLTGLIGALLW
jgi:hypothetical protein